MFKRFLPVPGLASHQNLAICHARRFARKRAGHTSAEESTADIHSGSHSPQLQEHEAFVPSVAGLRSGGMMAAPSTTSLDRIRSQVQAMQEEARNKAEQAELAKRSETDDETERHRKLTHAIKNSLARRHKPNETYYNSKDAWERVEMRSEVMRRTLFNEVDEVVRKRKEADTLHFMQLAFPTSFIDSSKVIATAERLRGECHAAVLELQKSLPEGIVSQADLTERAWLDVLETKNAEELRFMWQSGLLELADVEHLLSVPPTPPVTLDPETDDPSEHGLSSTESPPPAPVSEVSGPAEEGPLIKERVEQLHSIQYLQELAKELQASLSAGGEGAAGASVDLAPVLQKVHDKRFDDITDKDLKLLESYEEKPIHITGGTETGVDDMTQSLLDRALSPSNRLLFYVAKKDEKVRHSLEVLERIKRQALFDPVFQEAVRAAHEMEEISVDGHVRGVPDHRAEDDNRAQRLRAVLGNSEDTFTEDDSNGSVVSGAKKVLSPRKQRALRRRAGALSRPHHAADVPFFFGDPRSIVPPRGNFNLPEPALSAEERAERRGRRRRSIGRTRFSK